MADITPFNRKPEVAPEGVVELFGTGEAFCRACNATWVAVAPVGTVDLECPDCKAVKGRWKFDFYPNTGQKVRECNCGNQLFYLTPDGHLCANCGIYQCYD